MLSRNAEQNRIDDRNRRLRFRSRSNGYLPVLRDGAGQRLAHEPPMDSQLPRHPLDRPCAVVLLTPDLLE